ncbi:pentapeptide repeat-containing protein [Nonomuraea guangzhouensis]|uniref:Pentapeptide repeat-containing protein n=1 Tax=Nonomuraea guangzhouensis TaxID=1291555 RepID=A0ABW4GPU9_9ACTN|nr:pentapeptide repeat-containing protein [Nonomuraea guangzhouensis]
MTWFRWRRDERATAPLSRAEFDTLPPKERAELHSVARNSRRQFVATLLQVATTIGVLGGLLLTAQGLAQTAKSIDASREELLIARKGLEVAQKGQVTDRFSKAVEQLGGKSMDVRIGGVYALDGIGRDVPAYRQTTVDVLASYVVGNGRTSTKKQFGQARDVQTMLTVLGRVRPVGAKDGWIDLSHARLGGATLQGAYLPRNRMFGTVLAEANLIEADLSDSLMPFADLSEAFLTKANLARTNFNLADLSKARMEDADLTGTIFFVTNLRGADLKGATLKDADFRRADLTGATGLPPTAQLKKIVQWDTHTKWP